MVNNLSQKDKNRILKEAFIFLTLLFLTVLIGFAVIVINVRHLSDRTAMLVNTHQVLTLENHKLIEKIQASRLESCKRTYEGVRQIFRPFFPPVPRTEKQQDNLQKFNNTINQLKRGCLIQTLP